MRNPVQSWLGLLSAVALACLVLAGCGGGSSTDGGGGGGGGDVTAPTGGASPTSGSLINGSTSIVITFDESMDTATLLLGGALASEDDGGAWSTTTNTDDTLTVSPASAWTTGLTRALAVDAADLAGNALSTLNLSYDVDATAPTVSQVTPTSGGTISPGDQIVVRFSEAMATGSLSLGGALSTEDDGGVWSTTTYSNDTLTISPATSWTGGASRSLTVNAQDQAGNAVSTANLSYTVDATLPTGSASPANGASFQLSQTIVITFSESMDTGSLSLSGNMASESDGGAWNTTVYTDDTLTISPATSWTEGTGRTLTVNVDDLYGNALATMSLTYKADNTNPTTSSVTPTSSSSISGSQQVVVKFSESMDTSSLSLGGTMASESDGGAWSATSVSNDTLTVSPSSTWTGGASRTLTVDADDLAALAVTQVSLTYSVDTSLPTASAAPSNSAIISASQTVVITFSESMDTGSLSLGGTMASESNGGAWSTTSVSNDTLTISPSSTWTGGASRTLSVDADDLVGNSLSTLSLSYTVDTTAPSSSVAPAAPTPINKAKAIVITFNESMSTGSLSLGGSMASESNGGVWSTTTNTNDTLTISPNTTWSVGEGATLTADANDLAGNSATQVSLTYNVINVTGPIYFVSTSGLDTNTGLLVTAPRRNVNNAVIKAFQDSASNAAILVASGTYTLASEPFPSAGYVQLREGISLFGGFASNFMARTTGATVLTAASYAIRGVSGSGITNATVVDGFTLLGGSGAAQAYAVFIENSSPTLRNNLIRAGQGTSDSRSVYMNGGSTVLYNNTIDAGTGSTTAYGIMIAGGNPTIVNNIVFASGGTNRYCIFEATTAGDPQALRNNNLFCANGLYFNADTSTMITSISSVNALSDIPGGASGNVSADSAFADAGNGDFHLSASSPTSVTEGGFDLSSLFTTDKDGADRTVPWSMGAYEF